MTTFLLCRGGRFVTRDGTIIDDFVPNNDDGRWVSMRIPGYWQQNGTTIADSFTDLSQANGMDVVAQLAGDVSLAFLHKVSAASAELREAAGRGLGPLPMEGVKFDENKLPYHLIAPELLSSVADILAFGAKKYSARNWEKGMAWHRPFRACIGHLWDWWRGAGPDEETGKSHLWHAACCIMFLVAYEARGIGEDDRPR